MLNMPIMFIRCYKCTEQNGLIPNVDISNGIRNRVSFVVILPSYSYPKEYDSGWQKHPMLIHDPSLGYAVYVQDIDTIKEDNVFVFDYDDVEESRRQALSKMRQLWNQLQFQ